MVTITTEGEFTVLKVNDIEVVRVKTSDSRNVARLQQISTTLQSVLSS